MNTNFDRVLSKLGLVVMLGAMLRLTAAFILNDGVKLSPEGDIMRLFIMLVVGFILYVFVDNN